MILALPPFVLTVIAALLGLCIGSFLNVVIVRVPAGESIVRPGSHCACGAPIAWRDNLPVLSWLLLGGKARCCGRRISAQYPLVELGTAAAFVACWLRCPPAVAVCGWVLLSSLLAASCIDLRHQIIPEVFTLGLGVAGIVLSFAVPLLHYEHSQLYLIDAVRSAGDGLIGLLIGSGVLVWVATLAETLLKKEAMGMGDVLFVGAIGAFCGWQGALFAIFGGAVVGMIAIVALIAARRTVNLKERIPFGPMLAVAAAIYFLWLHTPIATWFAQAGLM